MLSIMTAVWGLAARMRRVASMPLRFGMAMSITTTSGDCSSAMRILSRPSAASATTAMSGCFSSKARKPSRTTVWSSANKMRMGIASVLRGQFGDRQFGGNQGSLAEPRVNLQGSSQPAHAFFHSEQAHAAHQLRVEPGPVVADGKEHAVLLAFDRHFDRSRIAVARRIVESFLHEAVDARLVLFGKVVGVVVGGDRDFEAGALGCLARMPVQRGDEPEIVEHGRAQQQG